MVSRYGRVLRCSILVYGYSFSLSASQRNHPCPANRREEEARRRGSEDRVGMLKKKTPLCVLRSDSEMEAATGAAGRAK